MLWTICENATTAIAGVCCQLSNAYLNSSNVNVLLAGRNVIVSRLATLVRMCDQKEVSKYNLLTASYLDQIFSTLEGCELYSSNSLGGMQEVNYDATIMPRGVIVPTIK